MTNEEAIKYLKQLKYDYNPLCPQREALRLAIRALEERPTREWIPVTERLPKDDEDVLVTYIGDAGYSFIEMVWFNEGKFLSQDGKFEISNVVAWMPLPEPYKRGRLA